jgi:hypothetical protein
MPFIEVEVDAGENSDMSLMRVFDAREEPYAVTSLVAPRRDGTEGPCEVTGWSADGPCPACAAKVWDSGDGVALLIYGGDEGIRLRAADSDAPWDLTDPSQWGEPCLLLDPDTPVS